MGCKGGLYPSFVVDPKGLGFDLLKMRGVFWFIKHVWMVFWFLRHAWMIFWLVLSLVNEGGRWPWLVKRAV